MKKLSPLLDLLSEEYLLVQAWKKASSYIRYHNWFADTLELEITTAALPPFLKGLSQEIKSGDWMPDALRLVPAPKSQDWIVDEKSGRWRPVGTLSPTSLRPLAHASLRDQVISTAIMLCLSERIETTQGDPRGNLGHKDTLKRVVSYGNRLFCDYDEDSKTLVHRWGSSKLYRGYYDDYKSFIARPELVGEDLSVANPNVFIVHSDIKQFYDRVRPPLLTSKIRTFQSSETEDTFFKFVDQVFDWRWHQRDEADALSYAESAGIIGYEKIALPQGLIAAGFFANIVLQDVDHRMQTQVGSEISAGVVLHDVCRYVDDLRFTVTASPDLSADEIGSNVFDWAEEVFRHQAPGLRLSPEKTKAAAFRGTEQPLLHQSRKMRRIQAAVSGGFDAAGGEEILQAVQGLLRSQPKQENLTSTNMKPFVPVPDVRDETVGRFAAGRFRKTYRSLRPLLENHASDRAMAEVSHSTGKESFRRARTTRVELDEEARSFSLSLINLWIGNPSNVRLLRVAVDLWPTPELAKSICALMGPYLKGTTTSAARRVAHYCLAELLRAGATETGIVPDEEMLPAEVDLAGYRNELISVALTVINTKSRNIPWYLRQQAMLLLISLGRSSDIGNKAVGGPENIHYREMAGFLSGNFEGVKLDRFALLAVVSRRSFLSRSQTIALLSSALELSRLERLTEVDIELAGELLPHLNDIDLSNSVAAEALGILRLAAPDGFLSLNEVVDKAGAQNMLRNEIGILSFALAYCARKERFAEAKVITPARVFFRHHHIRNYAIVEELKFHQILGEASDSSVYNVPSWVPENERWRFQLGFLIRFILTAHTDFSLNVREPSWKEEEAVYRPSRSHWLQRLYGFYNGQDAFGDNWLPISQFTQDLIYSLLAWPGCLAENRLKSTLSTEDLKLVLEKELDLAKASVGEGTGILMIKELAPLPFRTRASRPLRVCVLQSITPDDADLLRDLTMSSPQSRRKHRNHLSTALSAVEKMLDLRDTHKNQSKRLDFLILPELSVHPADVDTHLVPFARAFKTIILAGLSYHKLLPHQPLVNTAVWILPRTVEGRGMQIRKIYQGKQHLAPLEHKMNQSSKRVMGFRPCQWLIGYDFGQEFGDPLWLTAAICYDATDLRLVSDLRDRSDIFIIPALNQDVGTFDHMAQALHYHMYQLIIVANNGAYGGSNAYLPQGEPFKRQIFHTHGQPQASISFLEIDDLQGLKRRRDLGRLAAPGNLKWKYPPAGS